MALYDNGQRDATMRKPTPSSALFRWICKSYGKWQTPLEKLEANGGGLGGGERAGLISGALVK